MKKYLLLFLFSFQFAFSINVDSVFVSANNFYEITDFRKAISEYKKIIDSEISNSVLYYNIGNSHFKLNELGYARLYYEKAKLLTPNDVDLIYNLEVLENRLIDDIPKLSSFFLIDFFKKISQALTSSTWSLLTLIFTYLSVILICIIMLHKSKKYRAFALNLFLLSFPILIISIVFLLSNTIKTKEYGILITTNSYIKTAPSSNSENAFIINEGAKFELIDNVDKWSRIQLEDGNNGWIQNDKFLKVQNK
tara:strand:- start:11854 stop:12606 length:753 start_codon:yes stop_codon:yes gene_type:complete